VWRRGGRGFAVPVPDFRLVPLDVDGAAPVVPRPAIVLCTSGSVEVAGVALAPGHAAFVPANATEVVVNGRGQAFAATVG
jgi:mannose-6-phosphate isomerase class I